MPSHFCFINKLTELDNEDQTIKTLLASFGIDQTAQTKKHILVARNQQQTKVIGILISEKSQKQTLKVTYIYVKTMWRRLSIGNALIQQLEQDCQAKGITTVTATFDHENQAMNALTKSHKGWSDGEQLNAHTFSSRSAMEPVLRNLEQTMSNRRHQTRIKPLSECNPQDILQASGRKHVPDWAQLNDFTLSEAIKEHSRILIKNEQIIGWLITFPLAYQILDYRILWVDGEHRKTGVAITALAEIIRQAHFQVSDATAVSSTNCDLGSPWLKGFFVMNAGNDAMNNFTAKRLAPGTSQQSKLIYREKHISCPVR